MRYRLFYAPNTLRPENRLPLKIICASFQEEGSNNNVDNKRKHSGTWYSSGTVFASCYMPETSFIYKETFGICNIINTLGHGEEGREKKNISEECSSLPTKRESSTGGMSSGEEWTIR